MYALVELENSLNQIMQKKRPISSSHHLENKIIVSALNMFDEAPTDKIVSFTVPQNMMESIFEGLQGAHQLYLRYKLIQNELVSMNGNSYLGSDDSNVNELTESFIQFYDRYQTIQSDFDRLDQDISGLLDDELWGDLNDSWYEIDTEYRLLGNYLESLGSLTERLITGDDTDISSEIFEVANAWQSLKDTYLSIINLLWQLDQDIQSAKATIETRNPGAEPEEDIANWDELYDEWWELNEEWSTLIGVWESLNHNYQSIYRAFDSLGSLTTDVGLKIGKYHANTSEVFVEHLDGDSQAILSTSLHCTGDNATDIYSAYRKTEILNELNQLVFGRSGDEAWTLFNEAKTTPEKLLSNVISYSTMSDDNTVKLLLSSDELCALVSYMDVQFFSKQDSEFLDSCTKSINLGTVLHLHIIKELSQSKSSYCELQNNFGGDFIFDDVCFVLNGFSQKNEEALIPLKRFIRFYTGNDQEITLADSPLNLENLAEKTQYKDIDKANLASNILQKIYHSELRQKQNWRKRYPSIHRDEPRRLIRKIGGGVKYTKRKPYKPFNGIHMSRGDQHHYIDRPYKRGMKVYTSEGIERKINRVAKYPPQEWILAREENRVRFRMGVLLNASSEELSTYDFQKYFDETEKGLDRLNRILGNKKFFEKYQDYYDVYHQLIYGNQNEVSTFILNTNKFQARKVAHGTEYIVIQPIPPEHQVYDLIEEHIRKLARKNECVPLSNWITEASSLEHDLIMKVGQKLNEYYKNYSGEWWGIEELFNKHSTVSKPLVKISLIGTDGTEQGKAELVYHTRVNGELETMYKIYEIRTENLSSDLGKQVLTDLGAMFSIEDSHEQKIRTEPVILPRLKVRFHPNYKPAN